MSNFKVRPFSECDINEPFFDSLKADYLGFEGWFGRKAIAGENAYVYYDGGILAFLYIKDMEDEEIDDVLPKGRRMKIGTLKISDGAQGQRLGEGAIGVALWKWQRSELSEVYVTVFSKHTKLIEILESYGFVNAGTKKNGELVFVKDKRHLVYDTPKRSFPFIDPEFIRGKYIPINDEFHDILFQNSELKGVHRSPEDDALAASNGLCKVYIASPVDDIEYHPGDIAIIYRIHTGVGQKKYKSVATSYCTIVCQVPIIKASRSLMSFDDFCRVVGNKSVYTPEELHEKYSKARNLVVLEMLYNGYFGPGKNITCDELTRAGVFGSEHPYKMQLSRDEVLWILRTGGKDERDIIIN